jgi:hypothetical protein
LSRSIRAAFYGFGIFASGFAQMSMHVDESGRNDEPPGIHFLPTLPAQPGRDFRNPPLFYAEIGDLVETL